MNYNDKSYLLFLWVRFEWLAAVLGRIYSDSLSEIKHGLINFILFQGIMSKLKQIINIQVDLLGCIYNPYLYIQFLLYCFAKIILVSLIMFTFHSCDICSNENEITVNRTKKLSNRASIIKICLKRLKFICLLYQTNQKNSLSISAGPNL